MVGGEEKVLIQVARTLKRWKVMPKQELQAHVEELAVS